MLEHLIRAGMRPSTRALGLLLTVTLGACGARVDANTAPTPNTATDAGAAQQGCELLCSNVRRAACGPFNERCVAACGELGARFPARCAPQWNAYLACAGRASVTCAADGPEIRGCDVEDEAISRCAQPTTPEPTPDPTPTDRCLPDSSIPADIAAELCLRAPGNPVPHDCPGGAPSPECVPAPGGEGGVYCCAR